MITYFRHLFINMDTLIQSGNEMIFALKPKFYKLLLVFGLLGSILTQLYIMSNTFSTVVFWDGIGGGGSESVGIEVLVPFWIYPLQYLSIIVFILGIFLYCAHWYNTWL